MSSRGASSGRSSSTGSRRSCSWRSAASYRSSPTAEPAWTTTPRHPSWAARARLCAMEPTDWSTVASVGEPTLTRNVWWSDLTSAVASGARSDLLVHCPLDPIVSWLFPTSCGLSADRPCASETFDVRSTCKEFTEPASSTSLGRGSGVGVDPGAADDADAGPGGQQDLQVVQDRIQAQAGASAF